MYLSGVLGRGRALAHPPPTEPERARGLVARSQGSSTGPLPAQEPLQPGSRVANTASSSSLRLPGSILRTTSDPTLERRRRRASGPPTRELSGPEQAALNRAASSPSQRLGFARTSSALVSTAQREVMTVDFSRASIFDPLAPFSLGQGSVGRVTRLPLRVRSAESSPNTERSAKSPRTLDLEGRQFFLTVVAHQVVTTEGFKTRYIDPPADPLPKQQQKGLPTNTRRNTTMSAVPAALAKLIVTSSAIVRWLGAPALNDQLGVNCEHQGGAHKALVSHFFRLWCAART